MRLLAWNIRAGGGSRLAPMMTAIAAEEADVLVLSEYHQGRAGQRLRAALAESGYPNATASEPAPGRKGVLIAARTTLRDHGPIAPSLAEPWKLVAASIGRLRIVGVYMPNLLAKMPYWEALLGHLAARHPHPTLAIGDFNTCRHFLDETGDTDRCAHFMDRVEAIGYHDLWRRRHPERREYSWFSHRANGFRLDHAFFTPGLARRTGEIAYLHHFRAAGLSDHSAIRVDFEK